MTTEQSPSPMTLEVCGYNLGIGKIDKIHDYKNNDTEKGWLELVHNESKLEIICLFGSNL